MKSMATLPLEVHEVLEEEYRTLYDEEPPSVECDEFQLLDWKWACSILEMCGVDKKDVGDEAHVVKVLEDFVHGKRPVSALANSPTLTGTGRTLIDERGKYEECNQTRFNRRIVDEALHGAVKPLRDMRLSTLYAALHAKKDTEAPTALCISGGGIRSATFALGVVQGLASAGILDKFRYLSTVSGGGYIGSWLSSWARRHAEGIEGVQKDLIIADTAVAGHATPNAKIDPEPEPLRHLRDFSNYLSPRLGITSADTWTMAALYIRNLLLNLLVLVPILAALLAVPRVFRLLLGAPGEPPTRPLDWMLLCLAIAFSYIGLARPVTQGRKDELTSFNRGALFIFLTIIPLVASAIYLAQYWAQHAVNFGIVEHDTLIASPFGNLGITTRYYPLYAFLVMAVLPFAIYYFRYIKASAASRKAGLSRQGLGHILKKVLTEGVAAFVAYASALALAVLAALKIFPDPLHVVTDPSRIAPFLRPLTNSLGAGHLYVCFAVPAVLLIFFVQASVFVGLSGRLNEDDDREWWGRAGAYLLIAAVGIALLGAITVFGPLLLYRAPLILASLGGLSGVVAALFGFSAKTPANDKQKQDAGKPAAAMNVVSALAVPLFVIIALSAIALGTTWLTEQFNDWKVKDGDTAFTSQFMSHAAAAETATVTETVGSAPKVKITSTIYEVKRESGKSAENSVIDAQSFAHLKTIEQTSVAEVAVILIVAFVAWLLSFFIGANRFSMHSLYRNRLIRAYLGASRYNRDPDRFTGFDEHDNLQMYELHPHLIWSTTFGDEKVFAGKLVTMEKSAGEDAAVAMQILQRLPWTTRRAVRRENYFTKGLRDELLLAINTTLFDVDFSKIAPEAAKKINEYGRVRRNRAILSAFLGQIGGKANNLPIHIVNTTLNLTSGEKLAWQQRQGASFTISPLHSGSFYVGYRGSRHYGGKDGVSIGTAVTISGAAASPNQGYHSSPAVAFLLTLLNVRLGCWLGNPGVAGRSTYGKGNPNTNIKLLLDELVGNASDTYPWVYLSDGGHFENLGIYEMILRRCRYIVVSDAGCDPTFNFEDLGNAMRKIRTDLGVPIDFPRGEFGPRNADGSFRKGRYVAVATIRYSALDGDDAPDGKIVYIKPGLYDEDFFPKDVYNYAQASPDFPHESTADQFFSESQFESYRALGRHAINEICGNYAGGNIATPYTSVADFVHRVVPPPLTNQKPEQLVVDHLDKLATTVEQAVLASASATEDLAEKVTSAIKECCDGKKNP
jgi:Patatin-like phospholipase